MQASSLKRNASLRISMEKSTISHRTRDLRERSRSDWNTGEKRRKSKPFALSLPFEEEGKGI
jgi:hypothetical protein